MDPIKIPKVEALISFQQPSPAWYQNDKSEVFIRCRCGMFMRLLGDIGTDGLVENFHHVDPSCGFHAPLLLEGWDAE